MEIYSWLRSTADSWGLLVMTLFFLSVLLWAFRPGSKDTHAEIANSIFRNEKQPAQLGATRDEEAR